MIGKIMPCSLPHPKFNEAKLQNIIEKYNLYKCVCDSFGVTEYVKL